MHSLENYLRGRNCALASSFVLCTKTTFKMSQINYWSKLGKLITFYGPAQNVFDCDGLCPGITTWYPSVFIFGAQGLKAKLERERKRERERETHRRMTFSPPLKRVEWEKKSRPSLVRLDCARERKWTREKNRRCYRRPPFKSDAADRPSIFTLSIVPHELRAGGDNMPEKFLRNILHNRL